MTKIIFKNINNLLVFLWIENYTNFITNLNIRLNIFHLLFNEIFIKLITKIDQLIYTSFLLNLLFIIQ